MSDKHENLPPPPSYEQATQGQPTAPYPQQQFVPSQQVPQQPYPGCPQQYPLSTGNPVPGQCWIQGPYTGVQGSTYGQNYPMSTPGYMYSSVSPSGTVTYTGAPPYQPRSFSYPSSGPLMPICNPVVPFTTGIPNGLYHGQMIFIAGTPKTNAKRFNINIQDERSVDIGFHLDVRLNYFGEVNSIVRNHRSCSTWFQEERGIPYFPFVPNAYFEMIILCEHSGFKVAVNNHHLLEFKHKLMPFARFNTLNISGDVIINQVKFQ